ncbi:hypothetical protein [Streptomyces sp. T028]|uniref:hypothetical protein n=1 Tax=Streptomyces sp. T028 TaxID=3394379 RepID=UPI003A88AF1F
MTPGPESRAPDLLWDDVKWCFEPDGSLPDVVVPGTSVADWQAVLDLVVASGWTYEYAEGDTVLPLPRAETVHARPADAECPVLQVRPVHGLLAIFRFYSDEEIDFDVDPRELQGQDRLDVFCAFLRSVGRRLGKQVLMYPEGGRGKCPPLVGFDVEADRVVLFDERSSHP